jgi:hypothetical protein
MISYFDYQLPSIKEEIGNWKKWDFDSVKKIEPIINHDVLDIPSFNEIEYNKFIDEWNDKKSIAKLNDSIIYHRDNEYVGIDDIRKRISFHIQYKIDRNNILKFYVYDFKLWENDNIRGCDKLLIQHLLDSYVCLIIKFDLPKSKWQLDFINESHKLNLDFYKIVDDNIVPTDITYSDLTLIISNKENRELLIKE